MERPNPTLDDDIPSISELAAQLRDEYRDVTEWNIYENDVYAHVFEFTEHRRLQVWDEADNELGEIDGYSWQEQLWSGAEWVDVTAISTENDIPPLSVAELRERVATFRTDADATRPEMLSPREAALDHTARTALGAAAEMGRKVKQLERQLGQTTDALRGSVRDNEKIRAAISTLDQLVTRSAEHVERTSAKLQHQETGHGMTPAVDASGTPAQRRGPQQ